MTYAANVICDSMSPDGVRLTTMEVTFPRIVLAEFNTHRVFSRNSASSRAIPIAKRIEMVERTPYVPDEFGSNQKGMQSGAPLEGRDAEHARFLWLEAASSAVRNARHLAELGVHKEYANRLLEPFCWHTVIVTATEWENFFNLRTDEMASRPIRIPAQMMERAYVGSTPESIGYGGWHLPYVDAGEIIALGIGRVRNVSVGRCARVSYLTHDGHRDHDEDIALHDRLLSSGHMSPPEHVARPAERGDAGRVAVNVGINAKVNHEPSAMWFGNFRGWVQYRKMIPGEAVFRKAT